MNTDFLSFRCSQFLYRMVYSTLIFILLSLCICHGGLEATYQQVYQTTTNGGITFTGNTLGLNKTNNQNNPGISGSIGAFITTNTGLQVNSYPPGTTLNWTLNRSTAVLDLPVGSTILHAELVWSGSYGFDSAISGSVLNTPITFITPDSVSHTITPNPSTAQSRVNSGSNGFYVRSADVTSLVTTAGTYTTGGVPATVEADENNLNCAGWTLAVAYANPNMLTSSLTLFVGCEASGADAASVNGIHAPDNGTFTSRLFVSCLEGDAQIVGDHFLVGGTSSLSFPADAVSGSNNPSSNFFASQINSLLPLTTDVQTGKLVATGSSVLDTRGSFGTANSNASTGTGVSGARQGYDITSVDLGSKIVNGQTTVYAQGTTTGDVYTINCLGLQLQVSAPLIEAMKSADITVGHVGDVITYTMTFTNIGEAEASSFVFKDVLPVGLTYVNGSFTVNGVPVVNPNLTSGVSLGSLAVNQTITVVFQAEITAANPPDEYINAATIDYSFVPFIGGDSISLQSMTNPVTVTASGILPPVAQDDTGTTTVNVVLNGTTVLANDTGTSLTVTSYDHTTTQSGSVVMQPDGTYVYTPPSGFSGQDTFTYTVTDAVNQTDTATVTITVLPLAQADSAIVAANTTLNQATSVLSNDAGTGLTVTSYQSTSSEGGTVVVQSNGTYVYTPPNGFSGQDTFAYTATDSFGSTTSTIITITVLPVAHNDTGTTPSNTVLNGSTVFTNDVGSGLTLVSYDHTSTQGGTVTMNMLNGTYVYTPPNGFSGQDTFTYTEQDEFGSQSTATVTITVLPTAVNDSASTTTNVVLHQNSSVLTNDIGTALAVTSYQNISTQTGTVVMQSNGTYVYTPPLNFSGTDTFQYTATDTFGSSTSATVTITVHPLAINDTAITYANTSLIGSSILVNDTGSTLTVTSFQNVSAQGGNVAVNTNGTYTYMPPPDFSGIDTFQYTDTDSSGQTTSATVTITVLPVANNDSGSTSVNTALNGATVFSNDHGSSLSITSYDHTSTQGGTIVMNTSTGTYTYTPPANFSGQDTFIYTIIDAANNTGTATVVISVAPLAVNDTGTTPVNVALNQNTSVLSNDLGSSLTVTSYDHASTQGGTVVMQPDGTYVYTPPLHFSGADTFTYTIVDSTGNTSTATVIITVTPVAANDTATTQADVALHQTISTLINDEGTGLTITSYAHTSTQGGTIVMQPDGTYVYTPPLHFSGVDTFTYTATDAANHTTTAMVTVTVLPIANNDSGITSVNTPLNGSTVFSNDYGTSFSILAYDHTGTQGGTIVMNTSTGTYTYTPPPNFSGQDTFTYTIIDQANHTSTATVTIVIAPYAANDTGTTPVNVALHQNTSVLSNDVGSSLTVTSYDLTSTQGGSVVMQSDGTYVYTPPVDFSGYDTFTYTATDNTNRTTSATVTITVLPVAANDTGITQADTPLNGSTVFSNDHGSTLSIQSYDHTSTNGGSVVMNSSTGTYTYTPPTHFSGPDTFTYTIVDGIGSTSTATVTITVAPTVVNDTGTTPANTPLVQQVSILANDDGSNLTVATYDSVTTHGGTVVMQPDGTYVYTPPPNFSGPDTFTYTAKDSSDQMVVGTVTIMVTPVANNDQATVEQDIPLQGSSVLANDVGSQLTVLSYDHTSTQGGTIVMQANGQYVYTPAPGFTGTDTFTYTLIDGSGNTSTATVTIVVTPIPPPRKCKGVVKGCKFLNTTDYRLKIHWAAGSSPNIVAYRIYKHGKRVATIRVGESLSYEKCLKSHKSWHGYKIAAVNSAHSESEHVPVRIEHD